MEYIQPNPIFGLPIYFLYRVSWVGTCDATASRCIHHLALAIPMSAKLPKGDRWTQKKRPNSIWMFILLYLHRYEWLCSRYVRAYTVTCRCSSINCAMTLDMAICVICWRHMTQLTAPTFICQTKYRADGPYVADGQTDRQADVHTRTYGMFIVLLRK